MKTNEWNILIKKILTFIPELVVSKKSMAFEIIRR
jgi:hypothetical protein